MTIDPADDMRIAVVGMSGRFPGAPDVDAFWKMICDRREGVRDFDDDVLLQNGATADELRHPRFVRRGAPLDDFDMFDARYFGVTPRDAELMDPQHRILLEVCHAALESAGYGNPAGRSVTGVFVGSSMSHYAFQIFSQGGARGPMASLPAQIGNGESHLATRISYKLDLHGPSMFVQTACSTSLTAIHLACRSLLSFECDMALAGGSSLTMPYPAGYVHMEGGMLSADGHCRPFDAAATGTIIGNGAAAVVLKRYADALRDGDTVHALILGSAINNDGADRAGYTAPSRDGQVRVIAEALGIADVPANTIGLVEAHGTGTIIGDPIELDSLSRAYRAPPGTTWIGSVKSNVGHMLAAAGVAAFIKAVKALSSRTIPPSANFAAPNPHIDFAATPFKVAAAMHAWEAQTDHPRRAAVSSFGIGGSNAHIILEEAPPQPVAAELHPAAESWQIVPLSAASGEAVLAGAHELAGAIAGHSAPLRDIAWTMQTGRKAHACRAAVVVNSADEASSALELLAEGDPPAVAAKGPTAFLFPGQGMQRAGMFRALFQAGGTFRDCLTASAAIYADLSGDDLLTRIMGEAASDAGLQPTAYAQPALFAVEHAAARQLIDWGLAPGIMLGHSVGDYAAAAIAGVFTADDAMRVVTHRGRLMQAQAPGAMYAVSLSQSDVDDFVEGDVVLAAINAPTRSILAVPEAGIAGLEDRLGKAKVLFQRLRVSHAFHSPMMEPAAAELAEFIGTLKLAPPVIPMISSATGARLSDAEAQDPHFWAQQVVRPVQFLEGLRTLASSAPAAIVEVGPGDALASFTRGIVPASSRVFSLDPGRRKVEDQRGYLEVLAAAWCAGAELDWTALAQGERCSRVPLPTYRFDRQRFWISAKTDAPGLAAASANPAGELAKRAEDVADWYYLPSWRRTLATAALPEEPADWLLFSSGDALATRIATRLKALGQRVAIVQQGPEFKLAGLEFALRPDAPEDYRSLLAALSASGFTLSRIVHAWGLGAFQDCGEEKSISFVSPLLMAQALGHAGASQPIVFTVLATGAQRVAPQDILVPERALGIGPAKVIGQEFGNVESRHVDIVLRDWSSNRRVDVLIAELATAHPIAFGRPRDQHRIVALRGADRWIQTFEKTALPEPVAASPGGVHIVTGGLGGIGSVVAEAIAAAAPTTVVVTSRSLVEVGPAASSFAALRDRIERAGSTVRLVTLDPVDTAALTDLFKALTAEFGKIASIVHAAGAPGAGMIQLKTIAVANQVLAPKYEGTLAIEAALEAADTQADLLVQCSSLTSVRGGFGQVDYCAANAFLDAFAQAGRSKRIGQMISINWGAWAEVGMAVASIQKFGFIPCPFWLRSAGELGPVLEHALLDRVVTSPGGEQAVRLRLDSETQWILSEHKLRGQPTIPGTGHLEILRAAGAALGITGQVELTDVEFRSPATVADGALLELFVLADAAGDTRRLKIVTRIGQDGAGAEVMVEHVRAGLRPLAGAQPAPRELAEVRSRLQSYPAAEPSGEGAVMLGRHWQVPGRSLVGDGESLVELELPAEFVAELDAYVLHPSLLDVALGAARLAAGSERAMLPFGYDRIGVFTDRLPAQLLCLARRRSAPGATMASVDAQLLDRDGRVLVQIEGYRLREVEAGGSGAAPADDGPKASQQVTDALAGAILSHEGAQAFLAARSSGARQLVISPLELDAVVAKWQADERSMVDRVAKADLSRHDGKALRKADGAAPEGEAEARIAAIWQDLLGYASVSRDADFFELGGDSLLGIQLHNRLQETFAIAITLAAVFEAPTVAGLASLVSQSTGNGSQEPGEPGGLIPATSAASADALLAEFE
jgi:phthiocerol/phenolphthiocerol synthesis type-I polyketide synthase E